MTCRERFLDLSKVVDSDLYEARIHGINLQDVTNGLSGVKNAVWAVEFLRLVDAGESIHLFFGSWFDIQGQKDAGISWDMNLSATFKQIQV